MMQSPVLPGHGHHGFSQRKSLCNQFLQNLTQRNRITQRKLDMREVGYPANLRSYDFYTRSERLKNAHRAAFN